jgi:hypothetical protein
LLLSDHHRNGKGLGSLQQYAQNPKQAMQPFLWHGFSQAQLNVGDH